jgi:protein-S-isoprenylcysteine O-methyltransferase Ste14
MTAKLSPPLVAWACLAFALGLHFGLPVVRVVPFPYTLAGVAVVVAGMAIASWTESVMKGLGASLKPDAISTRLVTSGPFRVSRNPMYLGMTIALLGVAVFLGSGTAFLAPLTFAVVTDRLFIPYEEKKLEAQFGQQYRAYEQKTRRWF